MKIVIISDIHDNLINLEKCLDWCCKNNIEELICCGDVTNSETLRFLARHFSGLIHLVRGNMEIYNEEETGQYNNIKYYGRIGHFKINEKKVGICHEPYLIDKIAEKEGCDVIFYGHTHKPWQDEKDGIKLINPGTLGSVFTKATFAFWDSENNNIELILLEQI